MDTTGNLVAFGSGLSGLSSNYDRMIYINSTGQLVFGVAPGGSGVMISTTKSYLDGSWHHAAATLSPAGMRLYVDGSLAASNASVTTAQTYNGYWHAGCENLGGWPNVGLNCAQLADIDEVAVWSRALSLQEIQQIYRRGSNRVKYQIKTCVSADCSDISVWQGPDATAQTYFSELNNVPGLSGYPGAPYLQFPTVAPNLVINSNQPYVQYRVIFESDDANQLCAYNGSPAPCSPEINSTQFFRVNYDIGDPPITNTIASPYYQLQTLTGALGAAGCPSGVTYILSPDGTNNYYYNGSAWTPSNGSASQSNTVAQLTSSVMGAFSTQFPFGQTYFKALLASNGVTPCILANVTWTGTQ